MKDRYLSLFSIIAFLMLILHTGSVLGNDQENAANLDEFLDLSLTELMNIEIDVPASITERNPLKTPASVTTITAEDIARTPARNLMDLMEIYVPGAIYMHHSTGDLPGIRGVLVDRPYKFLVNVNGINVNIKSHYGARLELPNWDLNDISRVEFIRGPGSVTYGPGAIGGVINIYTKSAQQAEGLQYGASYWDKYDSVGNYISFGQTSEDMDFLGYLSVVDTKGTRPDLFGVTSSGSGYVGDAVGPSTSPPFTYMADFYGEPQIKAHIDMHLKKDWRFWARYVTSSSALTQGTSTQFMINGPFQDFRQTRYRYFQLAAENHAQLNNELELKSVFGFSSIDVHNVEKYQSANPNNDKDNLFNIGWIWSENEYYSRFMLNHKPESGPIKSGIGFEVSYDVIGPSWGDNPDDGLRLSDGIISGPGSDAYGSDTSLRQVDESHARYFNVGHGWETWSYAFLGELNWQVTPSSTVLISGRADKHDYTNFMFSPRVALIQELNKDEFLKLIVQRSVRKNTEEELYMSHAQGNGNEPEILDTLELIHTKQVSEACSFQTSVFYNRNDVIAWDWGQRSSASIGTLKSIGVELEAMHKQEDLTLGVNHSYVKQLDWDLADGVAVSGISYSDYYIDAGGGVVITSNGNDLNNWPAHTTKLFANQDLLDGKVTLHGDMKTIWGFGGRKDGLDALESAGGNAANIADIRSKDAYEMEISANLSLTYRINEHADIIAFIQNIPVYGDNKRYGYSSGFKKDYPDKVNWIEQPTVFGISGKIKIK